MSNPQSNKHIVTRTLNQEDQGVSSHNHNLRLGRYSFKSGCSVSRYL